MYVRTYVCVYGEAHIFTECILTMIVAGEVPGEEGDSVVGDNDGQTRAHVGGANRRRQDHNLRGL